jgi:hypothetical protein
MIVSYDFLKKGGLHFLTEGKFQTVGYGKEEVLQRDCITARLHIVVDLGRIFLVTI